MLSVFPELLSCGIFAPFVLRLVLGFFFLYAGTKNLSREKREESASLLRVRFGIPGTYIIWYLGIVQVIVGVSLLLGAYTQLGALLAIFVSVDLFFLRNRYPMIADQSKVFYILTAVVALSLLISGAGYPAIDLPL